MNETAASSPETFLEIPVGISVELGRTQLSVKEIVGLTPGSVVELDKPTTEPVELYANGRLIARGEVVVVDEMLGVKITEMVRQR